MTKNKINTLYTYFIIYAIAQGIMDAYEEAIETPYLKRAGLELGYIGIMQSIDFLPWCVKFLFAIPTDSYDFFGWGHRRPYVVMGLTLATLSFIALAFVDPATSAGLLYMACMIFRNIGIAVSDCAVNGLSVDAQVDSESGTLSGWMSLGRTIGTVACCCVAGVISRIYGYKWGIIASALFVVIPLPANYFIVEEWEDATAYKDKIEDAAVAAAGVGMGGGGVKAPSSGSLESPLGPSKALLADALGSSPTKAVPVWEAPLPFPEASKPAGWEEGPSGSGSGAGGEDGGVEEGERVDKARKLVRRPSFIARVAISAGFDWELLMELLSQTHVWMFLLYICFTTLGVAVANFSLAAWLESEHGFEADRIGFAMSAMSVGCFVASLPLGYLFDYLPFKRTMLFIAAASCAAANLILAFCKTELEAYMGLVAFGAAHGAIFVVQCSMARILADSRVAGVLFGIVDSCCNTMHMVGTAITGYIAEHFTGSCEDHQNWIEPWGFCEPEKGALDGLRACSPEEIGEKAFRRNITDKQAFTKMEKFAEEHPQDEPLWCDYILTFYVATAIDIFALFYVFGIPADKLIVEEGTELKILPHRENPIFSEASTRPTALNTTTGVINRNGDFKAALYNRSVQYSGGKDGGVWGEDEGRGGGSTAPPPPHPSSSHPVSSPTPLLTDRLGGVVMTEGLATYLEAGSLTTSVSTTFLPPNMPPPREVPHSMVHTAAMVEHGVYPRILPASAPLSAHIMQSFANPPEPPTKLAPRPANSAASSTAAAASAYGLGGGNSRSPRSPSSSSSGRRKSVAAVMEEGGVAAVKAELASSPRATTSTSGSWMNRPGLLPRLESAGSVGGGGGGGSSTFDEVWSSAESAKGGDTIVEHSNPLAKMKSSANSDGIDEWKPKHR